MADGAWTKQMEKSTRTNRDAWGTLREGTTGVDGGARAVEGKRGGRSGNGRTWLNYNVKSSVKWPQKGKGFFEMQKNQGRL